MAEHADARAAPVRRTARRRTTPARLRGAARARPQPGRPRRAAHLGRPARRAAAPCPSSNPSSKMSRSTPKRFAARCQRSPALTATLRPRSPRPFLRAVRTVLSRATRSAIDRLSPVSQQSGSMQTRPSCAGVVVALVADELVDVAHRDRSMSACRQNVRQPSQISIGYEERLELDVDVAGGRAEDLDLRQDLRAHEHVAVELRRVVDSGSPRPPRRPSTACEPVAGNSELLVVTRNGFGRRVAGRELDASAAGCPSASLRRCAAAGCSARRGRASDRSSGAGSC